MEMLAAALLFHWVTLRLCKEELSMESDPLVFRVLVLNLLQKGCIRLFLRERQLLLVLFETSF